MVRTYTARFGIFAFYGILLCALSALATRSSAAIPKAPSGLTATAISPVQVNLAWKDSAADETGFELERSVDGKTFSKIADLAANIVVYQNIGLTAATTYSYRVRAKNASGLSAYSNIAAATTKPPLVTIPKPPSALTAAAVSARQISLIWVDNATDETAFELERSLDGVNFVKIAEPAKDAEAYSDEGLTPVTKYWYRILAKNTAGKSAYSNVISATTLQVAPQAPENLLAVAVSPFQINLTWLDKSSNETGYQLERSADGANFSKIADLAPNATAYQNSVLTQATRYYYRVRAVNAIGPSPYSNVASAVTEAIPVPDMPQNLTAVPVAPAVIQLRWAALTGGATQVVIERAKGSEENFVAIHTQAASLLSYQDRDSLETADYFYRIKATNAGGSSPYSLLSIVRASSIITGNEPAATGNEMYSFEKNLVIKFNQHTPAELTIFDLNGALRKQMQVQASLQLDLHFLPAGLYIAVVKTGKAAFSHKFLVY